MYLSPRKIYKPGLNKLAMYLSFIDIVDKWGQSRALLRRKNQVQHRPCLFIPGLYTATGDFIVYSGKQAAKH
jgi:hypothetical protein